MRQELDAGIDPRQVVRGEGIGRGQMGRMGECQERAREGTVAGTGCTSLGTRL